MYDKIFKRVEEKYFFNKEQFNLFFSKIGSNLKKDKYYETVICNLYFDNKDSELIIKSLDKPIYKHKVRLRSYGIPKLDDDVFLEIKSKFKKVVNKRRIKLKLSEFNDYLAKRSYDGDNQIMREIDYLFNLYSLIPTYFIAYDRKSYVGLNEPTLRITVDTNLRSRKDNLSLEYGDEGEMYFDEEIFIVEIKTLDAMPLWLVEVLSEMRIYPISFSKYGKIFTRYKEEVC